MLFPEAILNLCHLSEARILELSGAIEAMVSNGLGVLGVAKDLESFTELPLNQHDFNFEYVGLNGFFDPVR